MLLLSLLLVSSNYFVAPNGNDTNTGNICCPWQTISNSLLKISGGDTLNIRSGVYFESIANTIPSGSNWDSATVIQAYNGETVVLNGSTTDYQDLVSILGTNKHYIILNGLTFDGSNLTNGGNVIKGTYHGGGGPAHHIRLTNCIVRNAHNGNGILLSAGDPSVPTYWEFLNCSIYSNGLFSTTAVHGLYITTSSNLVDGCIIYDNRNIGIQLYSGTPSGNVIRNSQFTGTAMGVNVGQNVAALGIYGGTNNQAYNNVFYNCQWPIIGSITADFPTSGNSLISANTFYSNYAAVEIVNGGFTVENNLISDSRSVARQPIVVDPGSTGFVRNNVLIGFGANGQIYNGSPLMTVSNNLTNQTWVGSTHGQRYFVPSQ